MENTVFAFAAVEKGKVEKVQLPMPQIDDYEVLVKNEGCVFCNTTDQMIVEELFCTPNYPVVFGHESFGRVVQVGSKVKKYKLGDRVICSNAIVKGYDGTFYSSWGGFATYGVAGDLQAYLEDGGVLDEANGYRSRYSANSIIPGDFSLEQAALIFPLAETLGAILQVGDLRGKRVVIFGTGIVGYFFCYFAKHLGAAEVVCIGRRQSRVDIALRCGADTGFWDFDTAAEYLNKAGGADVVFECSGAWQVMQKGLPFLKDEGLLAIYAVPHRPYAMDMMKFPNHFRYQRIDPDVERALEEVCRLMRAGKIPVELFLTHKWEFDRLPEAYEAVKRGEVIKGLVIME